MGIDNRLTRPGSPAGRGRINGATRSTIDQSRSAMAISIHSSRPSVPPPAASADSDGRLLLTLAQTALALAISKRTIERLIAGGAFPAPLKIGRSTRVPREDIANYLEQLRRHRGDKVGTS